MSFNPDIAVILLAAGASTRFGAIKQLLPWKGTTLIEHAIYTTTNLKCVNRFVVLGANYELIKPKIDSINVEIIINEEWELGMGKSIAFGINHILENNIECDGVLILLADQPLIDSGYLDLMIDKFKPGQNQIIASAYTTKRKGVPALFDKIYLEELSKLEGDKGAKTLLDIYSQNVLSVSAQHLISDIDTKYDYEKLYKVNGQ